MKKEHIITRQGKDFVLYEGILDEAHRRGLTRITTTLLQIPNPDNGNTAIVTAEVEMDGERTFSGIGDASPGNVGKMIVPHLIRMAETRAKARALRDAVNVAVTAVEELGGDDDGDAGLRPVNTQTGEIGESSVTANQSATIIKLARLLSENPPSNLETMTEAEARETITKLSRRYNELKTAATAGSR